MPAVPQLAADRFHLSGPRSARAWWITGALMLAFRASLLPIATYTTAVLDHAFFTQWGIQANRQGLGAVYTAFPEPLDAHKWRGGRWGVEHHPAILKCNYPPMHVYLLAISAKVWLLQDTPVINTWLSRAIFTFWSVLASFILAAGAAAIVRRYAPPPWPFWTYAIFLAAPPFWCDSVLWGQTETVVLAPAVWMVWAMLGRRWLLAGVLWGLALSLKTHGILFAVAWLFALLVTRPAWKIILGGILGGVVLCLIALPFTLTGGWAWFQESYWDNLFNIYATHTTIGAYNIWYLAILLGDSGNGMERWAGVPKRIWGAVALAAALLGLLAVTVRRWRAVPCEPAPAELPRDPLRSRAFGLLAFTAAAMVLIVTLPTKVHDRYVLLTLPWFGVLAMLIPRFWLTLVLLGAVSMLHLSRLGWMHTGLAPVLAWVATATGLAGATAAVIQVLTLRPRRLSDGDLPP